MKEQLIEFSTAKLAKEKGFDVPCKHRFFIGNGDLEEQVTHDRKSLRVLEVSMKHFRNTEINYFLRPTQSLLQKWLREEHDIFCEVKVGLQHENFMFSSYIITKDRKGYKYRSNWYKTHEQALEKGLQSALKLI